MQAYCLNAVGGSSLADFPQEHVPAALRSAFSTATAVPQVEAVKRVLPIEQDVRRVSRQSLVSAKSLDASHVLTRMDLTIKRPGTGIPPYELESVIGRRLSRNIEADMPLTVEDLV
jgi:sialic acid synthase SpsE